MAPRSTRKNALLATRTRGCFARAASAPAETGAASAHAPHRSLPVAVVATPSLHPPRTSPSRRDLSQPVAITQVGGRHPARRQHGDHFPGDFLASMLPGPKRGEEPRGEGPSAAEDPVSPALLSAAEAWCRAGGGRSIPPHPAIPHGQRNAVSRMRSALTFREERRGSWSSRQSGMPQGPLHRGGQGVRMTHNGTMTASR